MSTVKVPVSEVATSSIVFTIWPTVDEFRKEQEGTIRRLTGTERTDKLEQAEKNLAELETLVKENNLSGDSPIIPTPVEYQTRHAGQHLPKGARIVGWLDAEGYRHVGNDPLPNADWLTQEAEDLAHWCKILHADPK